MAIPKQQEFYEHVIHSHREEKVSINWNYMQIISYITEVSSNSFNLIALEIYGAVAAPICW